MVSRREPQSWHGDRQAGGGLTMCVYKSTFAESNNKQDSLFVFTRSQHQQKAPNTDLEKDQKGDVALTSCHNM